MNNALLYFGGFLVVVLAALFAVPTFIDWNGYRGVFEEEASKVLGRDVRVSGDVNVRFLPTPYVRFEKVRLADVSGQTGEPFIQADSFTMWLAISPLTRGIVEANKIELDRPVLTLALDGEGSGNWSSIQLRPGSLPFVPRDVTLHSVQVIEGTIAMFNASAQPVFKVDRINGDLSADGLAGPFRFAGLADWGGERRDVRFSTSDVGDNGTFMIKAATRGQTSKNNLVFDGKVEALSTKPKLTGDLTGTFEIFPHASAAAATIAVPTAVPSTVPTTDPSISTKPIDASPAAAPVENVALTGPPQLGLKASVSGDASSVTLSDLALSIENVVEPQIITGSASGRWTGKPRIDVNLSSKWLDLDRLASTSGDTATFTEVKGLAMSLLSGIAGDADANALIDVEQIKVAGESAGGFKIDAQRKDGVIRVAQLQAGLPGGSRLRLSGDMTGDAGQSDFNGQVFLHGSNLSRLKAWAEKSGSDIDIEADGPFSIDSRVRLSADRIDLTEASATIASRSMTGEVHIVNGDRQRADVTIETAEFDSGTIFPAMTRNLEAAFNDLLSGRSTASKESGPELKNLDLSFRILAGVIKHTSGSYRDVDARVTLRDGAIQIPFAKFKSENGLAIQVEGGVDNARTDPKGRIAFDVTAGDAAALSDAIALFGLAPVISAERVAVFKSSKLAGLVRIGDAALAAVDLKLDGMVGRARVNIAAEFDGGAAAWRTAPSRVSITADGDDLKSIVALAGAKSEQSTDEPGRPSRASISTSGVLSAGATTVIDVASQGLTFNYAGEVEIDQQNTPIASGVAAITAVDVRDVLGVLGQARPRGLTGAPIDGRFDVAYRDSALNVSSRGFGVGGSTISGSAKIAKRANGRPLIEADVSANRVSVAGLIATMVDQPASAVASVPATDDAVAAPDETSLPSIWSEGRFDTSLLSGIDGEIDVAFDQIVLSDGLKTGAGTMAITISQTAVELKSLVAKAAGGGLTGEISVNAAGDAVTLDTKLKLENADAASLGRKFAGQFGFDVSARGKAQTPAAIVSALTGSGTFTSSGARVAGPNLMNMRAIVDQVLDGKSPNDVATVNEAISADVAISTTDIDTQTTAVTIADGLVKFDSVTLERPTGKLSNRTAIDLLTLGYDSSWQASILPPSPAELPASEIPDGWQPTSRTSAMSPVAVRYSGKFDDVAPAPPTVVADAFFKDLVLLQTERQVDDLERLRRLDEQRARLEQERRKAEAAERAQARANRNQPPDSVAPPVVQEPQGAPSSAGEPQSEVPQSSLPPAGDGGAITGSTDQSERAIAPADPSTSSSNSPDTAPSSDPATLSGQGSSGPGAGGAEGGAGTGVVGSDGLPPTNDGGAASDDGANRPRSTVVKPRPRVSREAQPRRTPGDEIMRSIGAMP